MSEALHRRLREVQARRAIRAWELRQRNYANGVWFRLRSLLCQTENAYEIPAAEVFQLTAEGFVPETVGSELEPPRSYFVIPPERIAAIEDRRPLAVRLDADFLAAPSLALAPFAPLANDSSRRPADERRDPREQPDQP